MASAPESQQLIILHRFPTSNTSYFDFLKPEYTILDPLSNPPDPLFPTLSKLTRVILCWGPCPLPAADLDRYPAVECIIGTSAGISHFDLAACRRRGIRVTGTGDAYSDDVADYAVGLAIDVLRRVSAADRFVRAGSWSSGMEYPLGLKVSGKRVGILGFGNIGSRVVKRFQGFGCRVSYNSRTIKSHVSYPYYASVHDLAINSDILILCCALTDETFHVIDKDIMTVLGKTGIIINVGRGALIDEKELVKFLVRGDIGGAGLDVFEDEPHVPKELFGLDNVVLSPHQAVLTPGSFKAVRELLISNLQAFFTNKPLRAEVQTDSSNAAVLI